MIIQSTMCDYDGASLFTGDSVKTDSYGDCTILQYLGPDDGRHGSLIRVKQLHGGRTLDLRTRLSRVRLIPLPTPEDKKARTTTERYGV